MLQRVLTRAAVAALAATSLLAVAPAYAGDFVGANKVFDWVGFNDFGPWTHTFDLAGATPTSAQLSVRENYSDGIGATITIDGATQPFESNGPSRCNSSLVQTYNVPLSDLTDGQVVVTVHGNGDAIAVDWGKLVIQTSSGPVTSLVGDEDNFG